MFERDLLEEAVDLQARSYALLRWMAEGIGRGFIGLEAAHAYAGDRDAAAAWIRRHYADLPPAARPPLDHRLAPFCRLFASYLDDSHRLLRDPGQRLYSPGAHCFCAMCSSYINAPSLRVRPLASADLRRADRCMRGCLDDLALAQDRLLEEDQVSALMRQAPLREALALVAYATTLLARLHGGPVGQGVPVALWRRFAWTAQGAPRRGYRLQAEAILQAHAELARCIRALD